MAFDFGATYRLNDEWTFSAAVLYSDGTLKHTGIYDIEHETDRVGAGAALGRLRFLSGDPDQGIWNCGGDAFKYRL